MHRAAIITVMNGKKWVHARMFKPQVKQTLGEKWSKYRYNAVKDKMIEDGELELTEMAYKLKSTKATTVAVTRSNNEKLGLTIKKNPVKSIHIYKLTPLTLAVCLVELH